MDELRTLDTEGIHLIEREKGFNCQHSVNPKVKLMSAVTANSKPANAPSPTIQEFLRDFPAEFGAAWRQLPNKSLFFVLLAAWLALFHFLGNATLGYIVTPSLLEYIYQASSMPGSEDAHGLLIPFVVIALLYVKRKELLAVEHRIWWPGMVLFGSAVLLHVLGYLVQQARISIFAMYFGIYALMGLVWGPAFMRASFFPCFLLVFCVPMGSLAEPISLKLRMLATQIVTGLCQTVLGIDVIRDGTQIFSPDRSYQYEVAAACSGIRSLIAIFAVATIFAFLSFKTWWKRLVVIASAAPLAVAGNVVRLMTIVIAADLFGQETGSRVHESSVLSLLPYVPAIAALILVGHWLGESGDRPDSRTPALQPS